MDNKKNIDISFKCFGLFRAIFIVFLVLKLGIGGTSVVEWSWWLVTMPLWGPTCFVLSCILLIFLGTILIIFAKECLVFLVKCYNRKNP